MNQWPPVLESCLRLIFTQESAIILRYCVARQLTRIALVVYCKSPISLPLLAVFVSFLISFKAIQYIFIWSYRRIQSTHGAYVGRILEEVWLDLQAFQVAFNPPIIVCIAYEKNCGSQAQ